MPRKNKKFNTAVLAKHFTMTATFFLKKNAKVIIIDDRVNVGYMKPPEKKNQPITIYISYTHPIFQQDAEGNKLSDERKEFLMYGCLTHEILHPVYTPFDIYNEMCNRVKEKDLCHDIANVLEDFAIETHSGLIFGGTMLAALNAFIEHVYSIEPAIDAGIRDVVDPQLYPLYDVQTVISAMILVGDRGELKGEFLTKEAEDVWNKVKPLFMDGAHISRGAIRAEYVKKIYDLILPLVKDVYVKQTKDPNGSGNGINLPQYNNYQFQQDPQDDGSSSQSNQSQSGSQQSSQSPQSQSNSNSNEQSGTEDDNSNSSQEESNESNTGNNSNSNSKNNSENSKSEKEDNNASGKSENKSKPEKSEESDKNGNDSDDDKSDDSEKDGTSRGNDSDEDDSDKSDTTGSSGGNNSESDDTESEKDSEEESEGGSNGSKSDSEESDNKDNSSGNGSSGSDDSDSDDSEETENKSSEENESDDETDDSEGDNENVEEEKDGSDGEGSSNEDNSDESDETSEENGFDSDESESEKDESENNSNKSEVNNGKESGEESESESDNNSIIDPDDFQAGCASDDDPDTTTETVDLSDSESEEENKKRKAASEELFKRFIEELDETYDKVEAEEEAERLAEIAKSKDLPANSRLARHVRVTGGDQWLYESLADANYSRIQVLKRNLKNVFRGDNGGKKISEHGSRISPKRLTDGKLHTRVMINYRNPEDIRDMAVMIAVDLSGSMENKIDETRDALITMYEALEYFKVPLSVMGFTSSVTDGDSSSVHYHYVTWNHTSKDKESLACIRAMRNNYDFVAINEGTEMLKKVTAKHKLMIVLSDGEPCSMYGMSYDDADAFTKKAIDDARKENISVVGVGICAWDPMEYASMYGKDFVTTKSAEELPSKLSDVLKNVVKNWMEI